MVSLIVASLTVRVVEIDTPAIPYIKISFEGNLMYELAG
jgi:hypothetical protein